MKKIILSLAVAAISLASYKKADAQVSVQLNIGGLFSVGINSAPVMAAPMVANNGGFYYYDDIDCYYDIDNGQYIYPYNGTWYYSASIPPLFRDYDFRDARHISMNRRDFIGRGINPVAFNRQQMMNNNRGYNNQMGDNRRMNHDRFAEQNMTRQSQMQERRMAQMGGGQEMMNNRGYNNPSQNNNRQFQMQQSQRSVSMNNNGRVLRESRRRDD